MSDAIDAYARAAELDPGNAVIKERLALRKAQRNGGVLPSGTATGATLSAPNGSASGTGPDNRNVLGLAPIPLNIHPTAHATIVDRDRGADRVRDLNSDRLPFTLLERGGPPPPLLPTRPSSSPRALPSINGTSVPGAEFPFRPSEREWDQDRDRNRSVLLHQPIPERAIGIQSHHPTPRPQIQMPTVSSFVCRKPATSPTSGSVSGDTGTPVGSSSKRKTGEAEETSSTSFKLVPVTNFYDAETPDSKSSRPPSPAGVPIPNRVTDDDYDEHGVADALMGISTFCTTKPPSPRYWGHSQPGSTFSNRSHTSTPQPSVNREGHSQPGSISGNHSRTSTPQPSVNRKRPLSPSPDSDSSLKRSRMDVEKPSPPNSAPHPSGTPWEKDTTSRLSPFPFPPRSYRERANVRTYKSRPSASKRRPASSISGVNGGPQRRDSGSK